MSKAPLITKIAATELRYAGQAPRRTGFIEAAGREVVHKVFWAEYGRPDGEPVLFVHGGPGGGTVPANTGYFDPKRYKIILFDQRGCGNSVPHVAETLDALKDNTTSQLIDDMLKVREAAGIEGTMHVFGGSWGSTLSLAFAIAHPHLVRSLILRGLFLVRRKDLDAFYQGNAATYHEDPFDGRINGSYLYFAEAWERFVLAIPQEQRGDMVRAYHDLFHEEATTPEKVAEQQQAAITWSVWEGVTSYLGQDLSDMSRFAEPKFAKAFANIENHYFMNGAFFPGGRDQNYILDNIRTILDIPVYLVQGRYDMVCPMFAADEFIHKLKKEGAKHVDYRVVVAGHSSMDRDIAEALTDIMDTLPTQ